MYIARAARRRVSVLGHVVLLFYDRKVSYAFEARSDQRALASDSTEKTSFFQSQWKKIVQNTNTNSINNGAQKNKTKKRRKKRKMEKVKEAAAEMERLKLGPTKIWTGLVLHRGCVCLACLVGIERDRSVFLFTVNTESLSVLKYAGVNVSELR